MRASSSCHRADCGGMRSCVPRGAVIFEGMLTFRVLLVVVCLIAVLPPATSQTVLATAASTLFEGTPFILAGAAAQALWPRWGARMVPYLGCGCGPGPSARSLPAAAATWLVFGPVVAGARFGAALLTARFSPRSHACSHANPLADLQSLLWIAGCNGIFMTFAMPALPSLHVPAAFAVLTGAAAAFIASPCAIGAPGFAGMLHATMPYAGIGFLCVAGIVDLRAFLRPQPCRIPRCSDSIACILLAIACAIVASRNGASLVHPHFTIALYACSVVAFAIALTRRTTKNAKQRIVPAIMLAGALTGAPLPSYPATVTTLADAYAGQRITFTGASNGAAITRYAITCCRADAAPITVRLSRPTRIRGWVRAQGELITDARGLALTAARIERVSAPADPFVYR